jgi:hypothetical protein
MAAERGETVTVRARRGGESRDLTATPARNGFFVEPSWEEAAGRLLTLRREKARAASGESAPD